MTHLKYHTFYHDRTKRFYILNIANTIYLDKPKARKLHYISRNITPGELLSLLLTHMERVSIPGVAKTLFLLILLYWMLAKGALCFSIVIFLAEYEVYFTVYLRNCSLKLNTHTQTHTHKKTNTLTLDGRSYRHQQEKH